MAFVTKKGSSRTLHMQAKVLYFHFMLYGDFQLLLLVLQSSLNLMRNYIIIKPSHTPKFSYSLIPIFLYSYIPIFLLMNFVDDDTKRKRKHVVGFLLLSSIDPMHDKVKYLKVAINNSPVASPPTTALILPKVLTLATYNMPSRLVGRG